MAWREVAWEEFGKIDFAAGSLVQVGCFLDGAWVHWAGCLSRLICSVPESDPIFQLMASCRKKLADRMGVRGRKVPCAVLEFSSLIQRGGDAEGELDVKALFFFPIGKDAECSRESDGSGRIHLAGKVYVGLNYVHTIGITIDPAACPQAAQG